MILKFIMKNWLSVDLAFIRHGVTNMSISSEMIPMKIVDIHT